VLQRTQYFGPSDNTDEDATFNNKVDFRLVSNPSRRQVYHAVTGGYAQYIGLHNLGHFDHLIPVLGRFKDLLNAVLLSEKAYNLVAVFDYR